MVMVESFKSQKNGICCLVSVIVEQCTLIVLFFIGQFPIVHCSIRLSPIESNCILLVNINKTSLNPIQPNVSRTKSPVNPMGKSSHPRPAATSRFFGALFSFLELHGDFTNGHTVDERDII